VTNRTEESPMRHLLLPITSSDTQWLCRPKTGLRVTGMENLGGSRDLYSLSFTGRYQFC